MPTLDGMAFAGIIAAVFIGNLLTAAFLWAMSRAARASESELPEMVYLGLIVPPLVGVVCLWLSFGPPPPLASALGL